MSHLHWIEDGCQSIIINGTRIANNHFEHKLNRWGVTHLHISIDSKWLAFPISHRCRQCLYQWVSRERQTNLLCVLSYWTIYQTHPKMKFVCNGTISGYTMAMRREGGRAATSKDSSLEKKRNPRSNRCISQGWFSNSNWWIIYVHSWPSWSSRWCVWLWLTWRIWYFSSTRWHSWTWTTSSEQRLWCNFICKCHQRTNK